MSVGHNEVSCTNSLTAKCKYAKGNLYESLLCDVDLYRSLTDGLIPVH